MSDSGDRAAGGAGNKQTPHPHTDRCLNVGVVNLISFTINSQPTLELQLYFPAASVSGEGKRAFKHRLPAKSYVQQTHR